MTDITTIINNFGFPIACVIALAWYSFTTTDKLVSLTEKVTNALVTSSSNMKELADAIKEMLEGANNER